MDYNLRVAWVEVSSRSYLKSKRTEGLASKQEALSSISSTKNIQNTNKNPISTKRWFHQKGKKIRYIHLLPGVKAWKDQVIGAFLVLPIHT
jgi:hypothetical protein